ncbi:MAG: hypothetical protein AAGI10_01940 [Pseudomonadota bacterium]
MSDYQARGKDFEGLRVDALAWGYRMYARAGADGHASFIRLVQALFAVAAMAAALSLWLTPGSSYGLDLAAMKAGVTVGLLMVAAVFWRNSQEIGGREVHLDLEGREVRIVVNRDGDTRVLRRYRFDDLGSMEIIDDALHLFTKSGDRVAVVDLDPGDVARLTA